MSTWLLFVSERGRQVVADEIAAAALNPTEAAQLQRLLEEGESTDWTQRRADQAERALGDLVRSAWQRTDRQVAYRWDPQTLLQPRPMPSEIFDRYSDFVPNRWYGGWLKNAEHAAAFDSKTGEFDLAMLIDRSPGVSWWLRLYVNEPAYINRDPVGRYYPDFIVIDAAGVHWVVEAKSDAAARNDSDVAAKRRDAESWVTAVNESHNFGTWRYLFATETDIRSAADWDALVRNTSR